MSPDERIKPHAIEEQMQESYIDYAMSVIVARALPDVRDGFKPVHRRILYAMHESGLGPSRPYSKCAKVVGEVLGKYHPHGDSAVYEALVRMAQEWNLRYPLVDGQGNFGSIDGDSAAAYRYTECRLARLCEEFTSDLDKDTVDFKPTFDEKDVEPVVLPAQVPNLLINGSSGIAVGMATSIPPHNLTEVVDASIALIDNPTWGVRELMKFIPGPDFPTGGTILGREGIYEAYTTGRGKILVRAVAHTETSKAGRESIIVTEIPYQVNKGRLLEDIASLVREKKIEGLSDIRDESDRKGMRIVLEIKRGENSEVILNQLYNHSRLQTTFGITLLALVENRPVYLSLPQMIHHFLDHRREVITRRTRYLLDKALKRAHILEGLIRALDLIDQIIATIRSSRDGDEAAMRLTSEYGFSEEQARAILDMRLQRLTGLEREVLEQEHQDLLVAIADYRDILGNPARVSSMMKEELTHVKTKFGDERRTEIIDASGGFDLEDLIAREDMVITVSQAGYIKRQSPETYRSQSRGGRGIAAMTTKDNDYVKDLFVSSTHDYLMFFSDKGKAYWLKVYNIPEGSRTARGKAVINCIDIEPGEKITAFVPVDEFRDNQFLVMVTTKGIIKKVNLSAFSNPRKAGIIAIDLDPDDFLVNVLKTNGQEDLIIATSEGKAVRFSEGDVRPMGRTARGVRAIRLRDDDLVVSVDPASVDGYLFTVTEHGYGKRTAISEYRHVKRGGQGVINIITSERNGKVVATVEVCSEEEEIMIITQNGIMIRQKVSEVRSIGRSTQGVRLIRLDDGDRVAAVTKIAEAANGDEDLPPAGETPPEPPLEQGQAEAEGLADGEGI
ncbi:MAG: DNA gyrase subunit A [Candidatus Hinthialibacteria bacterium]|nr:DNA gyrase subunit A [bacterium]MBK7497038.1 DNA gyrase subunit A [Candidatus Omnitrophota bacterium]MBV6481974.1 DNA gyrase subunit A [bacterium]MCE7908744.1 DNA gyrase subunit A [Candidatus Omnitrophica bacterium COP1]